MPRSATTTWPSLSEYQEAIQAPALCFADVELQAAQTSLDARGLPRPVCGQFGTVYALETADRRWAVKCFCRNVPGLHERYARIGAHLDRHPAPCFIGFELLREGIRVQGRWYPLLKMDWVEGLTLNDYVKRGLRHPRRLQALALRWDELRADLQARRVAHGDLQHGNVLVAEDGELRLVDYDGMWVPALAGTASLETGHPNYQNPHRAAGDLDETTDAFAGELVAIALRALEIEPDLWTHHDNGENLLFREADLRNPQGSALLDDLRSLGDPDLARRVNGLVEACGVGLRADARSRTGKRSLPMPPVDGRSLPMAPVDRSRAGSLLASCLGYLRLALHLAGIWPAATVATLGVAACLAGDADRTMTIAAPAFAIAAALGLASFTTLYVIRTIHSATCTLFFGLLASIGLVALGAEWLTRGSVAAIADVDRLHLALVAGLLATSGLAAPVEIACRRLGVVTVWRFR